VHCRIHSIKANKPNVPKTSNERNDPKQKQLPSKCEIGQIKTKYGAQSIAGYWSNRIKQGWGCKGMRLTWRLLSRAWKYGIASSVLVRLPPLLALAGCGILSSDCTNCESCRCHPHR